MRPSPQTRSILAGATGARPRVALAAAAALLAVALLPGIADAAGRAKSPPRTKTAHIKLFAELDPNVPPPIDEGTEYEEPYSPHVFFSLRGAVSGRTYLMRLTREPRWDFRHPERWPQGVHCGLDTLVTSATRARGRRGSIAWGLEPSTSYTPFHGTELCPGDYLGTIREHRRGRPGSSVVATVLFSYPSLDVHVARPRRRARQPRRTFWAHPEPRAVRQEARMSLTLSRGSPTPRPTPERN